MITIFLDGNGQKWVWPIWCLDSKIDCLKNEQIELTDFLHTDTNLRKLKGDWKFLGWVWSKIDVASVSRGFKNDCISENEQMY